ncbi:kinetochore-associated Ndc80 complex subunit ndc80, partial [Exophiala xenobiotica]
MSQPPGMFSVRRPRETLGNIQNFSGIPQPASAVKRVSSSNELRNAPYTASHIRSTSINQSVQRPAQPNFHRSSSGGNLADLGMSTARRSTVSSNVFGSANTGRQSLAPNQLFGLQTPASQSLQRRSSIFSRPSGHGPVAHQSFFSQPPAPGIAPKDPRPLRDSSYRARLSQELLDYLTQNNFELEMKHSLTQNSVKSPTQKDFTFMFQWLYRRIDPGYKFQKSIDTEVPPIMKQLRYPYERDITKSHLVAVGGQNWPRFLGLLHWMMQLAQMLDNFTRGAYDDACVEAGVDVVSDRIVFRFLFGAYQDWLQMGPEDDEESEQAALQPHIQAMTDEFERTNAKHAGELKIYEAEHEALKAQVEEFERNAPDVAKLDKHFKILEDDKKKFEEYNANVQAKIEKYDSRIKILEAEIQ